MIQVSVIITIIKKLTVATLFLSKRFTPSLKNVVDGRICTIYSFSASVAGRKESTSRCRVKGFFFITISPMPNG
jgi:hypothetical protein